MELNKYQESAVLDESNTCLVRANVGSGKTTVAKELQKKFGYNGSDRKDKVSLRTKENPAGGYDRSDIYKQGG